MLKYILAILLNYKLTPIKELGEENELARSLYAVEKKNCIYFLFSINLNASVHTVRTRRCGDIHILKVNLEFAKRSFYFTVAIEFNGLPHHIKSKENLYSSQGHQHGVSIQSPINLGKTFLQISRIRKIAPAWILAKFFVQWFTFFDFPDSGLNLIYDIYLRVLIFFRWRDRQWKPVNVMGVQIPCLNFFHPSVSCFYWKC